MMELNELDELPAMDDRLLRVSEAAEKLGVAPLTLRRWSKAGYAPEPIRVGPRAVRYRESDIQRLVLMGGAA